jgi:S-adenosyl methyltransferase
MTDDMRVVSGIDTTTPNVARVWDYQLGGKDNFAADRAAARAINELCERVGAPDGRAVAQENRAFIGRAVRYLALQAGIDQFIDLGSGLPTYGNVHQVAQEANPLARTVYVDYDPMVLVHGQALLADQRRSIVIEADVREPETIFSNKNLLGLLDLNRPVAVLLVAMLHLIPDDHDAVRIVSHIRDTIAPGSYLALTHTTSQHRPEVAAALTAEFAKRHVTTPLIPRDATQIKRFFEGFELVAPGLVSPPQWRPDGSASVDAETDTEWMYAAVGRLAGPGRRAPTDAGDASKNTNAGHETSGAGAPRAPTIRAAKPGALTS